ncbi:MAG TPA: hypothetical protein VGP94_06235 [Tepidisphaeraceae bacterium]|nr:hypothetical protein [Tepidisphaeraceae bacterium]
MRNRATFILLLLLVASAVAAALAFAHMQHNRTLAERQQNDLHQSLRLLADLESNKSPARLIATRLDGSDLNRRIRDAATAAGISQNLSGIEPNRPVRVRDSDYNELMVFLRFESVSIRQLSTFMHRLSSIDPACRIKSIELDSPPDPADTTNWTSDLTLAYLTYAPRDKNQPEAP